LSEHPCEHQNGYQAHCRKSKQGKAKSGSVGDSVNSLPIAAADFRYVSPPTAKEFLVI